MPKRHDTCLRGRVTGMSAWNQALIHLERARELLVAHDQGRSLYDDVFVKERFEAANLPVPDDQLVLGVAGRRLNLALALHYLDTAIAIACRHGLGSGWRALPIHDGRGIRTDRQGGDRSHPQHNHKSRLIMTSGHPENYTSLTDATCLDGASIGEPLH